MRTGIGYDSHRFGTDRPLVLGGVVVPHPEGLVGHSDADVVAHAIADALLGAAALGDIGAHFPPDDPAWKDADSIELLRRVVAVVAAERLGPVNVDVTVVCEAPRIRPHAEAMRERLADALGVGVGAVSVKGTTNEGMGWVGRGEGIAVFAVATLLEA
jgi:2-C-methyl-D-erythritol 2,4-cyclodiphosphate synthase